MPWIKMFNVFFPAASQYATKINMQIHWKAIQFLIYARCLPGQAFLSISPLQVSALAIISSCLWVGTGSGAIFSIPLSISELGSTHIFTYYTTVCGHEMYTLFWLVAVLITTHSLRVRVHPILFSGSGPAVLPRSQTSCEILHRHAEYALILHHINQINCICIALNHS